MAPSPPLPRFGHGLTAAPSASPPSVVPSDTNRAVVIEPATAPLAVSAWLPDRWLADDATTEPAPVRSADPVRLSETAYVEVTAPAPVADVAPERAVATLEAITPPPVNTADPVALRRLWPWRRPRLRR